MDKEKALEMALAQIDKQWGKGAIMRLGQSERLTVEAISTGAIALDIALGVGGAPKGRITEGSGPQRVVGAWAQERRQTFFPCRAIGGSRLN